MRSTGATSILDAKMVLNVSQRTKFTKIEIFIFSDHDLDLALAQSFSWSFPGRSGVQRYFPWYIVWYLTTGFVDLEVGSRAHAQNAPRIVLIVRGH